MEKTNNKSDTAKPIFKWLTVIELIGVSILALVTNNPWYCVGGILASIALLALATYRNESDFVV